jgi:hypothetical protein
MLEKRRSPGRPLAMGGSDLQGAAGDSESSFMLRRGCQENSPVVAGRRSLASAHVADRHRVHPRPGPQPAPPGIGAAPGSSSALRCSACERSAAEIADASPGQNASGALESALGDLTCLWLVHDRQGLRPAWAPRRFCHECAPAAGCWPVECAVCQDGEGPIIAPKNTQNGESGHSEGQMPPKSAIDHLRRQGWLTPPGLFFCPACVRGKTARRLKSHMQPTLPL